MSIKFTDTRLNPAERIKVQIMNKPMFTEQDWRSAISTGTLDTYVSVMMKSDKINPHEFYQKYNLYYGNPETKLAALYNEFDTNTEKKDYEIPLYDNNGNFQYDEKGNQLFEIQNLTSKEYTQKMISESNRLYSLKSTAEAKERDRLNNNSFTKYLNDVIGVGYYGLHGVSSGIGNIYSILGALTEETVTTSGVLLSNAIDGFDKITWDELMADSSFAETVNKWYTDYSWVDDTGAMLEQFMYDNSHWHDENGQMQFIPRILSSGAQSIGEMIPTIAIGYATGGVGGALTKAGGTAAKVGTILTKAATPVSQSLFYMSNSFGRNVSEQYEMQAAAGMSICSAEIVADAALRTGLEFGIEYGLGKIFGPTALDAIKGYKTFNNPVKITNTNLTQRFFLNLGKDALQEGLEETLQDTSSYLVTSLHHFINHDFQTTEWSWQNIGDAFIIGALTSIAGGSARLAGTSVTRAVKTKNIKNLVGFETGIVKIGEDGKLTKNKDGEYDFVTLNPFAAYQYGLDMEAYRDALDSLEQASAKFDKLYSSLSEEELNDIKNNKKMDKAMAKYVAAYYQAVCSFEILSGLYGEIGAERFNKANEILKQIRENEDAGVFNESLKVKAQEAIVDSFETLDIEYKTKMLEKIKESEITRVEKTIKKGDTTDNDLETKAAEFLNKLEDVNEVVITKDGKAPTFYKGILVLPENLLKNVTDKVVISSIAEQKLAEELSSGVLTKSEYFKNEIGIVTDLYRQWRNNENVTEQEAVYSLIFDPLFFEVVLSLNERDTSQFLLRLNKLVDVVSKEKNITDTILKKRIEECRKRWIDSAFSYYANNLEKDTSLFTDNLTNTERKEFQERLNQLLVLYNMGRDIIVNPTIVKEDIWNFIDRRIDGMVDDTDKETLKKNLRDNNAKTRQKALDQINEYYDGKFNTLYDGKTYMPKNSIGNYAFNDYLKSLGLTLKTIFNDEYLSGSDLMILGNNPTLEEIVDYRLSQFQKIHSNMNFKYENGNVIVFVDNEADGFELYKNIVAQEQSKIVTGKDIKISDKKVERRFATTVKQISSWIKSYLQDVVVKNGAHEWLTIDEIVNHPEYLNDAVQEDIKTTYGNLDRISAYRYLQKELSIATDGEQSLLFKQDGTIVIGDMSSVKSMIKKDVNIPTKGKHSIKQFINAKYLTGVLGNVKVEFIKGAKTAYYDYERDGDRFIFVNKIVIDPDIYKSQEELRFALLHEFQHAIQFENRLNAGTSSNILSMFNENDRNEIIKIVKELEPELFVGLKGKDITNNVNSYLYYASGEFQAMGLGSSDVIGFYPVLFNRNKSKTKITFRNGKSFVTTENSNKFIPDTKNITGQELLKETVSIVTNEKTYSADYISDIAKDLGNLIKDIGLLDNPLSPEHWNFTPVTKNDVAIKNLLINWVNKTHDWLENDPYGYKYFFEHLDRDDGKLTKDILLDDTEKQAFLNNWKRSTLSKTHLQIIYELFKSMGEYTGTFSEFLETEIPVCRIANGLHGSPWVSAAFLLEDNFDTVETLFAISKPLNDREVINLYLGKCKIKDVIMFLPSDMSEVLIPENVFDRVTPVSLSLDKRMNLVYGYHLDTTAQLGSQELSDYVVFKENEQKEKAPVETTEKVVTTETKKYSKTKPKKAEGKIIDKRPKSERRRKFEYDSKKYDHSRTPLGESKHAKKIVTIKDIDQHVEETGKPIAPSRGGEFVYRKFVERRYYTKADHSEGYKDIFDYYKLKSERRHTLKSETEGNIKYFTTKKGKHQITMSPGLREFVNATNDVKVDPIIMDKIKHGTLTTDDLLRYVMDTPRDQIDNTTFRLILNKVYKNDSIKNAHHLDNLARVDGPRMVALYFTLKDTPFEDMLYEEITDDSLNKLWNFVSSQSQYSEKLNKIFEVVSSGKSFSLLKYEKFNKNGKYKALDPYVLDKESMYKFITLYKGDVATGSKAIIRARKAAFRDGLTIGTGYQMSRFGVKGKFSLDAKLNADAKVSFLDQLSVKEDTPDADDVFDYDYGDIIYELQDTTQGLGEKVYNAVARKSYELSKGDVTFSLESVNKYFYNFANLSNEQQYSLYNAFLNGLTEESLTKLYHLAELPGFEDVIIESEYTREQNVKSELNKIVNYGSKIQGVKRRLNTIKKYVKTTKERNLLLAENSDILDENLNLKVDAYRQKQGYKPMEIIDEIVKRVAQMSEAAKAGVYSDKTSYEAYMDKLDRQSKEISKLLKTINKGTTGKIKGINISTEDGNINIKSNVEVPKAIRQILSVGLTHTGRSKIQELSKYHEEYNEDGSVDKVYDDKYLKLTMTDLLEKNAELLNDMSEDEAIEILEFYVSDNIIMSDIDSQIISETVRLLCAYLLGEARNPKDRYKGDTFVQQIYRFNFDETLITKVEAKMMEQAHLSAAMLSNQRTIIRLLQPNKVIAQELAKNLGFKLDDVDEKNLEDMLTQMRIGNKKSYREAKKKFEEKLIKEYDEKSKQDVIDKLLTFERAMMLSNPGTWVRNVVSNYIVEGGNVASYKTGKTITDLFTKVFPKVKGKLEVNDGYHLDKKPSKITKDFVKEKFIDSGVLNEIASGISKYNDLSERTPVSDNIVDATARAIHSNIRRNQVFKENGKLGKLGKFGNITLKVVYKGLNDDPWVRRTTERYLGQIIEEDYQKARVKAESKGKTLTYEEYLKDDKTNIYGLSKHVASAFTKAVSLASYDYMKTGNFITQVERAVRENVPKGAWFMYKQVFPFLASSWNWCVEGMRYTPAGLAVAVVKLARLEYTVNKMDEARSKGKSVVGSEFAKYLQIRNIGKGTIGTFTFALGMMLVSLGWAGIDEEDDEYKLFIGDIKVNINDVLGSQGLMLGIALAQNLQNDNKDLIDVFSEAFNQLFRDSIFQDFIDTFRYDTGFGDFMWTTLWDIPTQFWPNILKTTASIVHHRGVEYSDDKLVSKLQRLFVKNLPLPEQWVGANTSINPYTGQVESFFSGEFFADTFSRFSPVKVNYPSISNNEAIAIGLGVKKGQLTGNYTIDGIKIELTSNDVTKLNMLYGKLNNQDLTKFYNNSLKVKVKNESGKYEELSYSKMTDDEKRAAINNIMSNNSSISKIYILTSTGKYKYKYYASDSEYEELRKLGITKNIYRKTDKLEGFVKI